MQKQLSCSMDDTGTHCREGLPRPSQASSGLTGVGGLPGPRSRHKSGPAAQKQSLAAGQLKLMWNSLLLPSGFVITLRGSCSIDLSQSVLPTQIWLREGPSGPMRAGLGTFVKLKGAGGQGRSFVTPAGYEVQCLCQNHRDSSPEPAQGKATLWSVLML